MMAVLNKRAFWFWPQVALCFFMFLNALRPEQSNRSVWLILVIVSLAMLYFAANAYEKKIQRKQTELNRELLKEMVLGVRSGREILFKSSRFLAIGLLTILVGFTALVLSSGTWKGGLFGFFLGLFSVLMFLKVAMQPGRTALVVSLGGIRPSIGCFIEWTDVSGIYLEVERSRGMVVGHRLIFRVNSLLGKLQSMSLAARCYYKLLSRGAVARQVAVDLYRPSESPELIRDLCAELWSWKTDNKNHWHPGMSEAMHSAFLDVEEIVRDPVSSDHREAVRRVNEGTQRARVLSDIFNDEMRKAGHWKNGGAIPVWVAVLVIGLVLFFLLLAFVGV